MAVQTTYDALDALYQHFDSMEDKKDGWMPDKETIEQKINEDGIENHIEFLMWLLESADISQFDKKEKEDYMYLNQLVKKELVVKEESGEDELK